MLLYFSGKMGRPEREGVLITEAEKLHCIWWTWPRSCAEGMHTFYSWNSRSYCSNTGHYASQKLSFVNVVARDMWLWADIPAETILGSTWRTGRRSRKNPNYEQKKEIIGTKTKNRNTFRNNTAFGKSLKILGKTCFLQCSGSVRKGTHNSLSIFAPKGNKNHYKFLQVRLKRNNSMFSK